MNPIDQLSELVTIKGIIIVVKNQLDLYSDSERFRDKPFARQLSNLASILSEAENRVSHLADQVMPPIKTEPILRYFLGTWIQPVDDTKAPPVNAEPSTQPKCLSCFDKGYITRSNSLNGYDKFLCRCQVPILPPSPDPKVCHHCGERFQAPAYIGESPCACPAP